MPLDGRLADLTEAEVLELLEAHPRVVNHVRSSDSRVVLMEKLYGDKEAKKVLQREAKRIYPNASVPEIDIPEIVKGEIAEDVKAIKDLRAELEGDRKERRHQSFRARLQEDGADVADLDAIETFMVDNEIGPKSTKLAVEKFYEAAELAEPRGTTGLSPELPLDGKDAHMEALLAAAPADDLDRINEPFAEKIFQEMFGAPPGRRGRS